MKHQPSLAVIVLVVAAIGLAGCGGQAAPAPTDTPEPTQVPTNTPQPDYPEAVQAATTATRVKVPSLERATIVGSSVGFS